MVTDIYHKKKISVEKAISFIKSGDRIYVPGNAATPFTLLNALARRDDLEDVKIYHVLLMGEDPFKDKKGKIRHVSLFVGPGDREAVNKGESDAVPIHLHEIPKAIRNGIIDINVTFLHTSPPDEHGFLSLGVEVIATKAALERSKLVIAQVNPNMPRTLGDSFVHISKVDYIVEVEDFLPELEEGSFTEVEEKIGRYVADLIEDGATLQLGIGGIPNAVLFYMKDKKDLGIHTEMISDGVMKLIETGVITGAKKTIHKGKVICTFILGTRKLYDFVNDNPIFELHPVEYVNDPFVISQNENIVAINSAIEVDLTGQVCSDSIGTYIYSGFGGQLDFIRGAARAKYGKPVIALPSTAKGGEVSRIVPYLKKGAGVVTTRADVHYVVTEYGVAHLWGKPLKERARALIEIAHPKFREELEKEAWERKLIPHLFYVSK
ncbi:MAG: acetyl-CoA hydrolase/transferase C-terminal domain-containing protein [candidate division WOR-3 bacterium]